MKQQIALLSLLTLAIGITVGCGNSNTVPVYSKVAFTSNRSATPATLLFVSKLDGTGITPIGNFSSVHSPSTSADFKKIAFTSSNNAFLAKADGTGQTQLTTNSQAYFARISPNGKKVMYSDFSSSPVAFTISNIDGSGKVNLTPSTLGNGGCYSGGFSADSSLVVLACYDGKANSYDLYTMKADGTNSKVVIQSGNTLLDTPSFTPDNKKIVFYAGGPISAAHANGGVSFTTEIHSKFHPRQQGTLIPTNGVTSVNVDGTGATLLVPGSFESMILNSTLYYTFYSSTLSQNQIYKSSVDGTNAVSVSDGTNADQLGLAQSF